jgi:hypothetical protein
MSSLPSVSAQVRRKPKPAPVRWGPYSKHPEPRSSELGFFLSDIGYREGATGFLTMVVL